ncbi:hypothetical protein G7054_g6863 [Neopestalotiopsis clavispora]|nr:hypothetical protein G7054_g6863 [Neopestalotiopsis clavispora]
MSESSPFPKPDIESDESSHATTKTERPSVKSLPAILTDLTKGKGSVASTIVGQFTEIVDSGTQRDVQMLYEGTPKCKCCINWVEDYPDNLKSSIEQEAETKKKALVIRMGKNHHEGRPLALDSIVVQNQHIKELLSEVFHDYSGMTPELKKLVLRAPFHPFFYRWETFKKLVTEKKTNDAETAAFSSLLFRILDLETRDTREEINDMQSKGVITYELLWALFHPGMLVYASIDGKDRVFLMENSKYEDGQWCSGFVLTLKFVDWDGERFGFATARALVDKFSGTKKIDELEVYPLAYHKCATDISNALKHRGEIFQNLKGVHYKAYTGDMLLKDKERTALKIDARIMIDASAAPPHLQIRNLTPLGELSVASQAAFEDREHTLPPMHPMRHQQPHMIDPGALRGYMGGMQVPPPPGGEFYNQRRASELDTEEVNLSDTELMLCNSHVVGYSLKDKTWGNIAIDNVGDVKWNDDAFPSLILPEGHKGLILAFVEGQLAHEHEFDDVIQGKGRGLTMLLAGAPGTGKTLTGEAVADKVRQPLYMLSAGELGQVANRVEEKLNRILNLTKKWKAVLLLDECDVFLEKRSQNNLNHNEVVAVFLRLLEYYPGMLFLTTNRGDAIDPAFQSRIHLTLQYPDLDHQARKQIWQQFCSRSSPGDSLISEDLTGLSELPLNGRQIKNIIKISSLLAKREGASLQLGHVETVLKATGQMRRGE